MICNNQSTKSCVVPQTLSLSLSLASVMLTSLIWINLTATMRLYTPVRTRNMPRRTLCNLCHSMSSNKTRNCLQRKHLKNCQINFWLICENGESNHSQSRIFRDSSCSNNWACGRHSSLARFLSISGIRRKSLCLKLREWDTIFSKCKTSSSRREWLKTVWTLS